MDGGEIDEVALVRRGELSRRDLVECILHLLAGLARLENRAVCQVDPQDVAAVLKVEDLRDFLDADAAAYEPQHDFGAVALADERDGPVHRLVELALRERLQQVVRGLDRKGVHGELIARRQEDDLRGAVVFAQLAGNLRAEDSRHADVEQDNVKDSALFDCVDEGEGFVKCFIGHRVVFILEIRLR